MNVINKGGLPTSSAESTDSSLVSSAVGKVSTGGMNVSKLFVPYVPNVFILKNFQF